jgi:predicted DNA-binding transcriptional regulator AlpA
MEDRLLKPQELAERLGTSMDWVYRHWKDFPFTVKLSPRQLRFSERGLAHYLARHQQGGSPLSLVPGHDD